MMNLTKSQKGEGETVKRNSKLLVLLVVAFVLFTGVAVADTLKITSVTGYSPAGQYNLVTDSKDRLTWDYCIEQDAYVYLNTPYDYSLEPVSGYKGNYGLIAADLIWQQYSDGKVLLGEMATLQAAIWGFGGFTGNYEFKYEKVLLENLFDIAYLPNFNVGNTTFGQDYVVYNPVPEPVSMLLFGTGLIGIGGYLRRRSKN
jgi:hypothetical protein